MEVIVGYAFHPKKMSSMAPILRDDDDDSDGREGRHQEGTRMRSRINGVNGCQMNGHGDGGSNGVKVPPSSVSEAPPYPRLVFRQIDLESSLEEQGPFDVILHKLCEDIMRRPLDQEASLRISRIEDYAASHANTVVVEHPRHIEKIVDREATCRLLASLPEADPKSTIRSPRFVVTHNSADLPGALADAPFTFPVICKPLEACGTTDSHQLTVVVREEGLRLVPPGPMLVQEYANHGGVMHKVYVLGSSTYVFQRKSLPDLGPEASKSLVFDSQRAFPEGEDFVEEDDDEEEEDGYDDEDMPSPGEEASAEKPGDEACSHHHCRCRPAITTSGTSNGHHHHHDGNGVHHHQPPPLPSRLTPSSHFPPSPKLRPHTLASSTSTIMRMVVEDYDFSAMAQELREAFHLDIFGFDVIISTTTGEALVVDVNYFPSYKEVRDFPRLLRRFLRERVIAMRR